MCDYHTWSTAAHVRVMKLNLETKRFLLYEQLQHMCAVRTWSTAAHEQLSHMSGTRTCATIAH